MYLGKLYLEKGEEAIDEVKSLSSKIVKKELDEAFSRSPHYALK
ncbi:hypothetical protein [Acidianus infernus]|nr:hypothetical protein [Acidianus infernus]